MPEANSTAPVETIPVARIYCLIDPRDETTFYVGKTIQTLLYRRNQHIQESRRKGKNSPRIQRIREILACGWKPIIALLEEVSESEWVEAEGRWTIRLAMEGHALLNVMSQVGVGGSRSYSSEWTPELEAKLGVVADAAIAEEMGLTRKSVTYRREILGIPASFDRTRNPLPPCGRRFQAKVLPEHVACRLGRISDYALAAETGISKTVIHRARHRRGIPSFSERVSTHGQSLLPERDH